MPEGNPTFTSILVESAADSFISREFVNAPDGYCLIDSGSLVRHDRQPRLRSEGLEEAQHQDERVDAQDLGTHVCIWRVLYIYLSVYLCDVSYHAYATRMSHT